MDDRDLSAEGILKSTGFTLVTEMHRGRDIHYEKTLGLLRGGLKTIFLLQRSSTLVLGPAFDSSNEFILATRLYSLVRETDTALFHLVSLEGIGERLRSAGDTHPKLDLALGNLVRVPSEGGDLVGVAGYGGRSWVLRHLDRRGDVENQVRFCIVEREDTLCEGVVVFRFGGEDFSLLMKGPAAAQLLDAGRALYERSPGVTWAGLGEVLRASVSAEVSKKLAPLL
ncbi:MAG TPA: hypothetical protein VM054_09810 [bacterium]|nr:hypothetical protein [bacterium]